VPAYRLHAGQAVLLESGSKETSHPPYSPDLAPSDCHLFPNLKKQRNEQRFSTDDELKYATEKWLKEQSELFFILQASKNSEVPTNCASTKAVIMLKNKCRLIHLFFIYIYVMLKLFVRSLYSKHLL